MNQPRCSVKTEPPAEPQCQLGRAAVAGHLVVRSDGADDHADFAATPVVGVRGEAAHRQQQRQGGSVDASHPRRAILAPAGVQCRPPELARGPFQQAPQRAPGTARRTPEPHLAGAGGAVEAAVALRCQLGGLGPRRRRGQLRMREAPVSGEPAAAGARSARRPGFSRTGLGRSLANACLRGCILRAEQTGCRARPDSSIGRGRRFEFRQYELVVRIRCCPGFASTSTGHDSRLHGQQHPVRFLLQAQRHTDSESIDDRKPSPPRLHSHRESMVRFSAVRVGLPASPSMRRTCRSNAPR